MRRLSRSTMLAALFVSVASCDELLLGPRSGAVVTGDWNGTHLSLSLDRAGGAAEYDCAHGRIDDPIAVDARGRFVATGMHVREHGGPVLEDETLDAVPATYWGRVDRGLLTMYVAVGTDTLGPFLLRRDAPSQLFKCM